MKIWVVFDGEEYENTSNVQFVCLTQGNAFARYNQLLASGFGSAFVEEHEVIDEIV